MQNDTSPKVKEPEQSLQLTINCSGCKASPYQIDHLKSAPHPILRETEEGGQESKIVKVPEEGTSKTFSACDKMHRP